MQSEIWNYLGNGSDTPYELNDTLEPGEEIIIAIGTRYLRPTNCFVLPHALFVQGDGADSQACDSLMEQEGSAGSPLALGGKTRFQPRPVR